MGPLRGMTRAKSSHPAHVSQEQVTALGTDFSDLSQENLMSRTKYAHMGAWESLANEIT